MILEYNLQFFAKEGPGGEKTEPATPKKLEDARKEGQVAKSKEVVSALVLLGLFLILKIGTGFMAEHFLDSFNSIYGMIPDATKQWNGYLPENDVLLLFRDMLIQILTVCFPFFAAGFILSFLGDLVQVKWKPTAKPMTPKLSKLNPINGFKRIFSVNSLIELLKAIIKIGLIAAVVWSYIRGKWSYLFMLYDLTLFQAISLIGSTVIDLGIRIAAVYMILAAADYIYQRVKFSRDMRMTKQEIKDEYKQSEGDPQIKGKIRQKMQEASRRRMMQDLPKADVVITNPTHYAVAIKYDPEVSDAPYVIAKGEDFMAKRIKDVARENHIEIVENKPLARVLYANVDIGQAIPPELYQAVAEVLAFVYKLQGKI